MVYQLAMGLIVEVELELGSNVVLIWGVVLAVFIDVSPVLYFGAGTLAHCFFREQ